MRWYDVLSTCGDKRCNFSIRLEAMRRTLHLNRCAPKRLYFDQRVPQCTFDTYSSSTNESRCQAKRRWEGFEILAFFSSSFLLFNSNLPIVTWPFLGTAKLINKSAWKQNSYVWTLPFTVHLTGIHYRRSARLPSGRFKYVRIREQSFHPVDRWKRPKITGEINSPVRGVWWKNQNKRWTIRIAGIGNLRSVNSAKILEIKEAGVWEVFLHKGV